MPSTTRPTLCPACQQGYLRSNKTDRMENEEKFTRRSCDFCQRGYVHLHVLLPVEESALFRRSYGRANVVTLEVPSLDEIGPPIKIKVPLGLAAGLDRG